MGRWIGRLDCWWMVFIYVLGFLLLKFRCADNAAVSGGSLAATLSRPLNSIKANGSDCGLNENFGGFGPNFVADRKRKLRQVLAEEVKRERIDTELQVSHVPPWQFFPFPRQARREPTITTASQIVGACSRITKCSGQATNRPRIDSTKSSGNTSVMHEN